MDNIYLLFNNINQLKIFNVLIIIIFWLCRLEEALKWTSRTCLDFKAEACFNLLSSKNMMHELMFKVWVTVNLFENFWAFVFKISNPAKSN